MKNYYALKAVHSQTVLVSKVFHTLWEYELYVSSHLVCQTINQ